MRDNAAREEDTKRDRIRRKTTTRLQDDGIYWGHLNTEPNTRRKVCILA